MMPRRLSWWRLLRRLPRRLLRLPWRVLRLSWLAMAITRPSDSISARRTTGAAAPATVVFGVICRHLPVRGGRSGRCGAFTLRQRPHVAPGGASQPVLVLLHGPGRLLSVRAELLEGVDAGRYPPGRPRRADGSRRRGDDRWGWCDEEARCCSRSRALVAARRVRDGPPSGPPVRVMPGTGRRLRAS